MFDPDKKPCQPYLLLDGKGPATLEVPYGGKRFGHSPQHDENLEVFVLPGFDSAAEAARWLARYDCEQLMQRPAEDALAYPEGPEEWAGLQVTLPEAHEQRRLSALRDACWTASKATTT